MTRSSTSSGSTDDEWELATKIFQILHNFVQPSSNTYPSQAAARLDALFNHNDTSAFTDPEASLGERRAFLQEIWGGTCYIAKRVPAESPMQDRLVELMKCLRDMDMQVVPALGLVRRGTRKDRLIPRKKQRTLSISEIKRSSTFPTAPPSLNQRPQSECLYPKAWLDLPVFLNDVSKVIVGNDSDSARNFGAFIDRVKANDLMYPPYI